MALTSGDFLRATGDAACESRTAAQLKADLNLETGTDLQTYDAGLLSIAGLTTAANKMIYTSALDVYAVGDLTAFARTILDDADAAAVLGTLGLSTDLVNLTDVEVTQLEAIGATTVSAAQWGYLGGMDQAVATTDSPEFAALTLTDAGNIVLDTTTGSQIGTAVGQKLGFWAATPIVQPTHADQADQGAMTGVAVGDLVATQNTGWGASTEANFDKIHTAIDQLVADVTALDTLLTAIRTALVNAGIMKGAA